MSHHLQNLPRALVGALTGAALALRYTDAVALRGFDPVFTNGMEDVDLCHRLASLGKHVVYVRDAVCIHEGGASMPRPQLLPELAASRVRYARKHFGPLGALAFRAGVAAFSLTHLGSARSRAARRGHARALRRALTA
jgi:GT2 family glycosyltransferase